MNAALILARTLHYASLVSLAGVIAFVTLIAGPALRATASEAAELRRSLAGIAWGSLAVALLSGALWLVLEGESMSGRPLATVFSRDIVGIVLTRTQFGHDWIARGVLALALAAALPAGRARPAAALALAASAAMLGGLAWAGHAGATPGAEGVVHVVSDVLHLLAAGAWLGGLVPLALLFARARRRPVLLDATRLAARRFSVLGIASVTTLLVTGIVNSWILVGTIPGLLGTLYGQLLLLKVAGFAAMVAVAAINRQRLTPALLAREAPLAALARLRRNTWIEAALGLAILGIVGALGTLPPAEHTQPVWPLPFRLNLDALPHDAATVLAGAMIVLGFAVLALAARTRRGRWASALLGLALIIGFGWRPLAATLVPALPTSFYHSPVADAAPSIVRGAAVFAANCAACHGADGRGDGPLASSMPVKPADLTAAHIFGHSDGDLFWWISQGIAAGGMPGFAPALDERQRWDVINFIHARAAPLQPQALTSEVTAGPPVPAPDFAFERSGSQDTLHETLEQGPVLLVLYRLPEALPRLRQLAQAQDRLTGAGLRLLALPLDATPPDAEGGATLPAFAATSDPATRAAYALFEGAAHPAECEFLIDRAGFLRARWTAAEAAPLPGPTELLAQLDRIAQFPLQQQQAHVHAH